MSERLTGAPSSKAAHIKYVKKRYLKDRASLGEIAREIEMSVQTISRWLQEDGVVIEPRPRNPNASRTPSQELLIAAKISASKKGQRVGGRPRLPREMRACSNCHQPFEARVDQIAKRFCSVSCARQHDGTIKHERIVSEYLASPESKCACGEVIPYENRHIWRYCSDECRNTYGKKRQKDPANHITFNCKTCGKEVTRYRNYGSGQNKFCSNACAQKHTNVVKHYVVREIDVVLDSGWECLFAGLCYFIKLPIERMDRTSAIEWGPGQHYAPDFYLPSLDLAIEIKGNEDDDDPARWDIWRESMGKLIVLDQDGLNALRKSPDPVSWLLKRRR